MPGALPEFQRFQYAFTAHIRNPKAHPLPRGVEAQRMRIYRSLVYNNIQNFLLGCFPVLKKILGTRRWERLVRRFLDIHRSRSPFFRDIPGEFIQFLQKEESIPAGYPEFVLELAHYEWIELVLSVSAEVPDWDGVDTAGSLLEGRPVLNPVLANLYYHWPVHHLAPRVPVVHADTYLLVFRDFEDQVRFIEINAFTARLINLLDTTEHTGQSALEMIAMESRHPAPEAVIRGGVEIMRDLQARGALLGVYRQ
ncbi:MAG TPA: putative DNA-binding domain-containing protein [Nitrosospira sp.]|nr:putative DNA-binding domain-containing protein [Nitrosospira sp.]